MTLRSPALLASPAIAAALLGLAHPQHLTVDTARTWLTLHTIMSFVFPLIAVGPVAVVWIAAARTPLARPLPHIAAATAAVYAVCYSALDVLVGMGAGVLVEQGLAKGEQDRQVLALQLVAEPLGAAGGAALVCCLALASFAAWKAAGRPAVAGALVSVVGAWGMLENHVYWPFGTLTMLCLGVGVWMLARCLTADHNGD